MKKFNIGTIVPIEYGEALRNYTEAALRYNDSHYDAKIAEVVLKQIYRTLVTFDLEQNP